MIVKMHKVYVVARNGDRDRLLGSLRDLGVVHLVPVDPAKAVAEEQTVARIDRLRRAVQVLSTVEPAGEKPAAAPHDAAEEVLKIQRESVERQARLGALHRQVEQLAVWGDLRLSQLDELRQAGLQARFHAVPDDEIDQVRAECIHVIGPMGPGRVLVAVVSRGAEPTVPENSTEIEPPARDRPAVRAEAGEIDEALRRDTQRQKALAQLVGDMQAELGRLHSHARYSIAERGGLADERLFAVQGWVPHEQSALLADCLSGDGIDAAVQAVQPAEDEDPPTLIRYAKWARPIKGLFDILGTLPGYHEMDLSPFFMIALPVFAAMLIGDAGYGLVFLLLPALFYGKLVRAAGKAKVHLLMVIGVCTIVWGVLSANYFGITPETMANAGGFHTTDSQGKEICDYDAMAGASGGYAAAGNLMRKAGVVWIPEPQKPKDSSQPKPWNPRDVVIAISFILGSAHLIVGHIRRLIALAPDQTAVAEVGWCVLLAGMLNVIWLLFFNDRASLTQLMPIGATLIVLGVGAGLAICFAVPARNPLKRIGVGFASFLLPLLGTFSDTMSYIRLMAVGLASYYIAAAFNGLGATLAGAIGWYSVVPIVVILFGHLLNLGLAAIAIFAHGVRLNMLEFSSNAGVQWAGHQYLPFAKTDSKET